VKVREGHYRRFGYRSPGVARETSASGKSLI
jgi:hypothetical protein